MNLRDVKKKTHGRGRLRVEVSMTDGKRHSIVGIDGGGETASRYKTSNRNIPTYLVAVEIFLIARACFCTSLSTSDKGR